jgi:hypothetical protein
LEFVPNQTQTLELESALHLSAADIASTLTGILPLIGGDGEEKVDDSKLLPLGEPPWFSRSARRFSAATSAQPASALSHSYPPKLPTSAIELPSTGSSATSITESRFEETRRVPEEARSRRLLWRSLLYFACQCFSTFVGGWNDSATVSTTQ